MNIYFHHDGIPAQSTHYVREFLNEHVAGKWIGHGGSVDCLSKSPDLT